MPNIIPPLIPDLGATRSTNVRCLATIICAAAAKIVMECGSDQNVDGRRVRVAQVGEVLILRDATSAITPLGPAPVFTLDIWAPNKVVFAEYRKGAFDIGPFRRGSWVCPFLEIATAMGAISSLEMETAMVAVSSRSTIH